MKKLLCMILTLATVLSLCACGKKEEDDTSKKGKKPDKQTEATVSTEPTEAPEPTLPAEPTEEEKTMMYEYITAVRTLYSTANATLDDREYSSDLETVQFWYKKLQEFDNMKKWANTPWAAEAYEDAGSPESFNPETDWDLQAVLANFTTVEDVILRYEQITTDHLGNITDTRDLCQWHYGADGNAIFITDEPKHTILELTGDSNSETYHKGLREYDEAGRLTKITEYRYDNIYSIVTFTYDTDGKLIKQEKKMNTSGWVIDDFTYDAEGRLTKVTWAPNYNSLSDEVYEMVYTYNADGTLAKEEKNVYDLTNAGERVIKEYYSMEYTYANGRLASGFYTEKEYHITTSFGQGVTGSWLSSEYTDTRTYTHDDQGRVAQEVVIPGNTIYYTYDGKVQQTKQPTVATYTCNTYYGDYYVYTPAK